MMEFNTGGGLWSIAVIVGPILLGAVLLWAVLNNRRSRRQEDRTEKATHDLYEKIDREDKSGDTRGV